jgi:hypothetical protein
MPLAIPIQTNKIKKKRFLFTEDLLSENNIKKPINKPPIKAGILE